MPIESNVNAIADLALDFSDSDKKKKTMSRPFGVRSSQHLIGLRRCRWLSWWAVWTLGTVRFSSTRCGAQPFRDVKVLRILPEPSPNMTPGSISWLKAYSKNPSTSECKQNMLSLRQPARLEVRRREPPACCRQCFRCIKNSFSTGTVQQGHDSEGGRDLGAHHTASGRTSCNRLICF